MINRLVNVIKNNPSLLVLILVSEEGEHVKALWF